MIDLSEMAVVSEPAMMFDVAIDKTASSFISFWLLFVHFKQPWQKIMVLFMVFLFPTVNLLCSKLAYRAMSSSDSRAIPKHRC
jgi:hypothetical protein